MTIPGMPGWAQPDPAPQPGKPPLLDPPLLQRQPDGSVVALPMAYDWGQGYNVAGGWDDGTQLLQAITQVSPGGFLRTASDGTYKLASTLVLTGVSNLLWAAGQLGSVGWAGNVSHSLGTIQTLASAADGVQIYGQSGAETQGLVLQRLSFTGANANAVVHFGGRQRKCSTHDVFIQNTNAAAGAYAMIVDAGIVNFNSEDQSFHRLSLAGAWACLGLGTADLGQHANDTTWYDLTTATTGPYAIVVTNGSNHHFHNYYDRSSPGAATATVWNAGGQIIFWGGEDLNNNSAGAAHQVDSGAVTTLVNRTITAAGTQTTLIITGRMILEGRCGFNSAQTAQVNAGGVLDLSDPKTRGLSSLTITGAGTVILPGGGFNDNSAPTFAGGFTGTISYAQLPAAALANRSGSVTTTVTQTWTPPKANTRFRLSLWIRVSVAGTSTIPTLAFTQFGGAAFGPTALPMWKLDGAAAAPVYSITATGTYVFTGFFDTDSSGTAVQVVITPTGSTFSDSLEIEQLP